MDFQIKLFNWQDKGNHLIVIVRGNMDGSALTELFEEIEKATCHLCECKVLVDLSDGACEIYDFEVDNLIAHLPLERWPRGNKIALVSAPEVPSYHRLYFLRTALSARGLCISVFRNSKIAIDWLAGVI